MSESKSKSKFDLASIHAVDNKLVIDEIVTAMVSKSTKAKAKVVDGKAVKLIPCWIYIGRLKAYPAIEMTQVRFVDFPSLDDCLAVCEELFISYTIKSVKKNEVLIKK